MAPIVGIAPDGGSLEYVNHLRKKQPLAELVPKQYLPISTELTESPLKNLDVFLQSKRVDFTQHEWSSCHSYSVATPTGTNLTEVKCEYAGDEQYGNANGVVAMIEFRKIPDDGSVSRGVSIGIKGSTRVLSTNPLAFEADELGDAKMSQHGALCQLYGKVDEISRRGKVSFNKQAQIHYADLVKLMDKPPAFSGSEWERFQARVRDMGADGLERLRCAIGMRTRANVLLTEAMQLTAAKDKMITQPAKLPDEMPDRPPPAHTLVGAIFRTTVEFCFHVETHKLLEVVGRSAGGSASCGKRGRDTSMQLLNGGEDEEDAHEENNENSRRSSRLPKAVLRLGSDPSAAVQRLPRPSVASKKTSAATKLSLKTTKQRVDTSIHALSQAVEANTGDLGHMLHALKSAWSDMAGVIDRL